MKTISILFALLVSTPALAADSAMPASPHGQGGSMQYQLTRSGKVLSTIDVPSYTYIEVSQGNDKVWIATNTMRVKKGDAIHFDPGMEMHNFYSSTLKRTFPKVLFVGKVVVDKK
jgi:hypothetical protein